MIQHGAMTTEQRALIDIARARLAQFSASHGSRPASARTASPLNSTSAPTRSQQYSTDAPG